MLQSWATPAGIAAQAASTASSSSSSSSAAWLENADLCVSFESTSPHSAVDSCARCAERIIVCFDQVQVLRMPFSLLTMALLAACLAVNGASHAVQADPSSSALDTAREHAHDITKLQDDRLTNKLTN